MPTTLKNAVSVLDEVVSYETLMGNPEVTLRKIATEFKKHEVLPSELLQIWTEENLFKSDLKAEVEKFIAALSNVSVCLNHTFQYPARIRAARYPVELFYYRGNLELVDTPCVSVVGARKCSPDGAKRAEQIAKGLVAKGYTIVSGLAAGIDTVAMTTTMREGGRVIGVIGTPLNRYYPAENRQIQDQVAKQHLLISHVPFYRYEHQPFNVRRFYFPERNELMAALSLATVIVEASNTSGTLTQARACLHQGRKLFILNSCFENPELTWPAYYEQRGAIRVREMSDIANALEGKP